MHMSVGLQDLLVILGGDCLNLLITISNIILHTERDSTPLKCNMLCECYTTQ